MSKATAITGMPSKAASHSSVQTTQSFRNHQQTCFSAKEVADYTRDYQPDLIQKHLCLIKQNILSLGQQVKDGIISLADAEEERKMLKEKEFKIIKKAVDRVHVLTNGKTRAISWHDAVKGYPQGYWYTRLPGEKIIKAKDQSSLYARLYEHYYGTVKYTIDSVFYLALAEKESTENPKEVTISKNRNDYKRFISAELAACDIQTVTHLDLREYTQTLVRSRQMSKSNFMAYKGILNLIFNYAFRHRIITENPVSAIKNNVYLKSCDLSKADSDDKIFSPEEIEVLKEEVKRRMSLDRWKEYYILGYAMFFAILTGVRVGELCAFQWDDVDWTNERIHIHAQQLITNVNGHVEYVYDAHTKNEKGLSASGRFFPLTDELKALLKELKSRQDSLKIKSSFVFCNKDGEWIKEHTYVKFLRRICQKVGLKATNNHAFRMSLNSNVLIPRGISVADRAYLLGHSVQTNLNYYSFAKKDVIENARAVLNSEERNSAKKLRFSVIPFPKEIAGKAYK